MTLTPSQAVLLGLCALAAIGVGSYGTYFAIRQTRGFWRAAMAAAPDPVRMRWLLILTLFISATIGLAMWYVIASLFVARLAPH